MFKKIEETLFYLLVLLLPTQLAYHLWPNWAFVFGVRVDYLAPTIYLTDILLIALLAIARTKIKTTYLLGILSFALINIFISISPWVSFWKWLKILELIFFAKYVYDNIGLIKDKIFSKVLSFGLITISLLGIFQFLKGGTLGGLFYIIGERTFSLNTPGIALQEINGADYLRAYSTFSHPNSLAGFLALGIFYLTSLKKKDNFTRLALVISSICFLLTFSLSSFIATAAVFVFWMSLKKESSLKKGLLFAASLVVLLSLLLPFVAKRSEDPLEVRERIEQAALAKSLISKHPIFGTGLNTFSLLNPKLQPVHNIFLLILSETGVVGLVIFLTLVYKAILKKPSLMILGILVISFFDHYFISLQQNLLTLPLVFGTIFASQKRLKLDRAK